jgi:hypothetical protein
VYRIKLSNSANFRVFAHGLTHVSACCHLVEVNSLVSFSLLFSFVSVKRTESWVSVSRSLLVNLPRKKRNKLKINQCSAPSSKSTTAFLGLIPTWCSKLANVFAPRTQDRSPQKNSRATPNEFNSLNRLFALNYTFNDTQNLNFSMEQFESECSFSFSGVIAAFALK